jgi:aminoglycoside/choline kinase family phosphotransferase
MAMENAHSEIVSAAIALSRAMPEGAFGEGVRTHPISAGGSDRAFYRISEGERTAVLLVDGSGELGAYLSIGRFLRNCGIAVPEIYGVDEQSEVLLMEDLGSLHLEEALRHANTDDEHSLYRDCIGILVSLETTVTEEMFEQGLLAGRRFGRETLLGETEYFRDEFIGRFCAVTLGEDWERERNSLAELLARQPAVFMHRDFQSRNMLLKEGKLRLIDFQTAHRGPGLYDAASLLKDPYHPLSPAKRRMFLAELYEQLRERGGTEQSFDAFHEAFVLAGIQRNLQALAAFVRLGLVKGKREFLDSIPAGLDLLEEGIDESGRFPSMKRMAGAIRERLEKGND